MYLYFNYILDSWYEYMEDDWVNMIYHKNDKYKTPILLQPNKQNPNTQDNSINIDMISYLNRDRLLKFYSSINSNIAITSFFKPNKIKIDTVSHGFSYSTNGKYTSIEKIKKVANQVFSVNQKYGFSMDVSDENNIYNELKQLENSCDFKYINQLYITFKILKSDKSLFNDNIYQRLKKEYESMLTSDRLIPKDKVIQENEFENLFKVNVHEYLIYKIKKAMKFQTKKINEKLSFINLFNNEYLKLEDNNVKEILNFIPPWVDIDFYENEKELKTLSSGEKALLTLITNIIYQFQNINEESYESLNIVLDETELGLHPNWQKKYLKHILDSIVPLNKYGKRINIILATHSPFILSDLSKENVIYLKDGKQEFLNIDTFGANIHTLLSHGFFMKNGLMGEFAKDKIDTAIKYLNQIKLTEDEIKYCENIISIIGEPIIKRELQKMLDSKRLSEVEQIKQEIKRLEERMTSIWKNSK